MSDETARNEFPDEDQRLAVANQKWKDKSKVSSKHKRRNLLRRHSKKPIQWNSGAKVVLGKRVTGGIRTFDGLAYSGGELNIEDWEYPVVVNVEGLKVRDNLKIRLDHNPEKRVGHAVEVAKENGQVFVKGAISAKSESAKEVIESADNGFPWQLSIGASPIGNGSIKFIPEGRQFSANGQSFIGPAFYILTSELGEVSFVDVGGDEKSRVVFAKHGKFIKWFKEQSVPRQRKIVAGLKRIRAGVGTKPEVKEFTAPTLEEWLSNMGIDPASLSEEELNVMTAVFNRSVKAARKRLLANLEKEKLTKLAEATGVDEEKLSAAIGDLFDEDDVDSQGDDDDVESSDSDIDKILSQLKEEMKSNKDDDDVTAQDDDDDVSAQDDDDKVTAQDNGKKKKTDAQDEKEKVAAIYKHVRKFIKEEQRKSVKARNKIRKICANYDNPSIQRGSVSAPIEDIALELDWTPDKVELECLRQVRAGNGRGPYIQSRNSRKSSSAIEAAFVTNIGQISPDTCLKKKWYSEEDLDRATTEEYRTLGLHELYGHIIQAAGMSYSGGFKSKGFVRTAFEASKKIEAAGDFGGGFSSLSLTGILSNVANKVLVAMFESVNDPISEVASTASLNDFKDHFAYRMVGIGEFTKVGATGELKDVSLDETEYKNRLETHGATITLNRQMQINDDLNAFLQINRVLGRMAMIKLQKEAHTLLLSNPTGTQGDATAFFAAGHNNLLTGASSALSIDSLSTAKTNFRQQTDENGDPIGVAPSILFVCSTLEDDASVLLAERSIIMEALGTEGTASRIPQHNPHVNKFRQVTSEWLDSQGLAGESSTQWYLLAEPSEVPIIEVGYLNGRRQPVVEGGDLDMRHLGVGFRSYWDFGVAMREWRGGVKSDGA